MRRVLHRSSRRIRINFSSVARRFPFRRSVLPFMSSRRLHSLRVFCCDSAGAKRLQITRNKKELARRVSGSTRPLANLETSSETIDILKCAPTLGLWCKTPSVRCSTRQVVETRHSDVLKSDTSVNSSSSCVVFLRV